MANVATIENKDKSLPRFIAIEGPIGVGKTTLARKLAQTFNATTLLEDAKKNPFLKRFYHQPKQTAFQTQLFFLLQRAQQISDLRQEDLLKSHFIADFLLEKDQIFAQLNLEKDEYQLYDQIYQHLAIESPSPDLVVYLQAPTSVLFERINKRGHAFESSIQRKYLSTLNNMYTEFFHYYDQSPLLIVNTIDFDLVDNESNYQQFIELLVSVKSGRHFFNPAVNNN